jgi:hypothetical protein
MVNLWFLLIMDAKIVREVEGQNLQVAHSQPWFQSFLPYIYTSSSFTAYFCALKMEADGSSKMLVIICQTTQRHIQDHNLNAHHCKNPQISKAKMFYFADVGVHATNTIEMKSFILSISKVCILICSVNWLCVQFTLQNLGLADGSVGILISYRLDGWSSNPFWDKRFFSSLQSSDQLWADSSYYPKGTLGYCLGVSG